MTEFYIRKNWSIAEEQPEGRSFPSGSLFTPQLQPLNRVSALVSDAEFIKILSAINAGARIIYPDEYGALLDIWLNASLDEIPQGATSYYTMDAPFIKYFPDNPYADPESETLRLGELPAWSIYTFEPPQFIDDFLSFLGFDWDTIIGYRTGDLFSTLFNARFGSLTSQVTDWLFGGQSEPDYIGFEIHVNGQGTLSLEVLSVPLGGRVLWQVDEPITLPVFGQWQAIFDDNDDLLETELDLVSLPPEQDKEDLEEITITGDGNHVVYVRLLPTLNDALIPFNFGAGFRSIRLSDGLSPVDPDTGEIIEIEDGFFSEFQEIITVTKADLLSALTEHEDNKSFAWIYRTLQDSGSLTLSIDPNTGELSVQQAGGVAGLTAPEGASVEQSLYAQAFAVGQGFKDLVAEFVTRKTVNGNPTANIVTALRRLYKLQPAQSPDQLIDLIDTTYANASNEVSPVVDADSIARIVYCEGADGFALQKYAQNIADSGGTDVVDIATFYDALIQQLQLEQIKDWYESGIVDARDGFQSADCFRYDPFNYTYLDAEDTFAFNQTRLPVIPNLVSGRRYLVNISGQLSDQSGISWDGMYYNNNNVVSYAPIQMANPNYGNGSAPQTQPQLSSNGYSVIYSHGQAGTLLVQGFNLTALSGTLTLKFNDLGAS